MATGEMVYLLMESLRAHLQQLMVTSVPAVLQTALTYTDSEGESRVLTPALIKVGRLQDDPTRLAEDMAEPSAHIGIHPNDPDDTSDGWKHTIASSVDSSATNLSLHIGYPYEIGGSRLWWRRFKVPFSAFFIYSDQTQAEAARLANLFRAMLERYCESRRPDNPYGWQCGGMTDSFGETAIESHVAKSHCAELGGPDDDYIWTGAIWVQVLTERN